MASAGGPPIDLRQLAGAVTEGFRSEPPDEPEPLVGSEDVEEEAYAGKQAYLLLAAGLVFLVGDVAAYLLWRDVDLVFWASSVVYFVAAGVWWGRSQGAGDG